jgi:hypothetical protein
MEKKKRLRDRIGLKQIAFDVHKEWHEDLKLRAMEKNMSMKDWILEACGEKIKREKELGW